MRMPAPQSIHDRVFALVVGCAEKRREVVAKRLRVGGEVMCIPCPLARPDLEQPEVISDAWSLPQDLIFGHALFFDRAFGKRLHDFEELGYCRRGDVEMAEDDDA